MKLQKSKTAAVMGQNTQTQWFLVSAFLLTPGFWDKIVLNSGISHFLVKLTKNIISDNLEQRIHSGVTRYTQDWKEVLLLLCFNGNEEIINMK